MRINPCQEQEENQIDRKILIGLTLIGISICSPIMLIHHPNPDRFAFGHAQTEAN